MKDDKALRKAMSQIEAQLPYGFHSRVMEKIYQEAEYGNNKSYVMGVLLRLSLYCLHSIFCSGRSMAGQLRSNRKKIKMMD
jgi:hypothetical protein